MLGLSQTHLSQEILLLGFLYVNNSFPWTAPSSSRAPARSHAEPTCNSPELPASLPRQLDAATGHHVIGEEDNPFAASLLNPE